MTSPASLLPSRTSSSSCKQPRRMAWRPGFIYSLPDSPVLVFPSTLKHPPAHPAVPLPGLPEVSIKEFVQALRDGWCLDATGKKSRDIVLTMSWMGRQSSFCVVSVYRHGVSAPANPRYSTLSARGPLSACLAVCASATVDLRRRVSCTVPQSITPASSLGMMMKIMLRFLSPL